MLNNDSLPNVLLEHIREYHLRACLMNIEQADKIKARIDNGPWDIHSPKWVADYQQYMHQGAFHIQAVHTLNETIGDTDDLISNELWQQVIKLTKGR